MTRSRQRKLRRCGNSRTGRTTICAASLAGTALACLPAAQAQVSNAGSGLEEVIVTATKRAEDIQNVPLSIQALTNQTLEEMHVSNFQDYAQLLPSVSFQGGASGGQPGGSGFSRVYMRGVATGGDGNHSGPQPSVGMYLDEQPITMVQGSLDIHIYDIQRVEALAGPQGTLYGASSEAGTIRIITNKPDPSGFKAGYNLEGNVVTNGTLGGVAEGFVNVPLSSRAAVRLVGWAEKASGFIDNIPQTFAYSDGTPGNGKGVVINNAAVVKDHYNDSTKTGARAALRFDLNDSWTITPAIITQQEKSNGFPGFNPNLGDLKVTHYKPEQNQDSWVQAALTIEGKINNFDLVYAGAFLKRNDNYSVDYTDYSMAYDNLYGYAAYFINNNNELIDGSQHILGKDHYQKYSNELRLSSPKDNPFRFVVGVFQQRQQHEIEQRYFVNGLKDLYVVTGWPNTWWLTQEERVDRDYAAFTELSYDLTPKLTATAGVRYFESRNSLQGFFGYGANNPSAYLQSHYGEQLCKDPTPFHGAPCQMLPAGTQVDDSGNTPKLNFTYHVDNQRLMYLNYAKGFRPGGINRFASEPYKPDYLSSYEFGWKTSWAGNSLRFNGAVFREDWKDVQFAFLGANGITFIKNVGSARIKGVEISLDWAATNALNIDGALAYYDAKLTQDYCRDLTDCANTLLAPSGTQLPITPKIKGNVTGRYRFDLAGYKAFAQGALVYQDESWPDLRIAQRAILGELKAFTTVNLSTGVEFGRSSLELFVTNVFDNRSELSRFGEFGPTETSVTYIVPAQPRTIGIKFGQNF